MSMQWTLKNLHYSLILILSIVWFKKAMAIANMKRTLKYYAIMIHKIIKKEQKPHLNVLEITNGKTAWWNYPMDEFYNNVNKVAFSNLNFVIFGVNMLNKISNININRIAGTSRVMTLIESLPFHIHFLCLGSQTYNLW